MGGFKLRASAAVRKIFADARSMQRCENREQPWQRLRAFIKLLAGIVAVLSVYAMISILILLLTSDLKMHNIH